MSDTGRILVLGATGYVGGRLVPSLVAAPTEPVEAGDERPRVVRCLSRSRARLESIPWGDRVEIVEGDLEDLETVAEAFADVDTVVYLVHSLDRDDFEEVERTTARTVADAAASAGVRHIVYMSGLGSADDDLSPHLRSRHRVGQVLADGPVPVTELRAAIVLGAGSASFEMLRSLVEVLPAMIAPAWVTRTLVQPIAITDVLHYLVAAIDAGPTEPHRIVEIGGPDQLTYQDLIQIYADVAGLRRRPILPVPFVSPMFSEQWVNLVTPLPRNLARSLIDSLRNDVVVTDDSARTLSDHGPKSTRAAIESSLSRVRNLDIPTRWSGTGRRERAETPRPWDPEWSGGTVYDDVRTAEVDAAPEDLLRVVRGIGGDRGWYGFAPLWTLRGWVDKIFGGVGLRRGRRHPDEIAVGEALDFWRVEALDDSLFRLHAEMRLPGDAWLEWSTEDLGDGRARLTQRAQFVPRGLLGRVYWWTLWPFHVTIFPVMVRRLARAGTAPTPTD